MAKVTFGAFLTLLLCFFCRRTALGDGTQTNDGLHNYPLRCLVRQFNFTATVTDANGKQCRGEVSTKACFGSCDSYEVGTYEFPFIHRVQPVCNYDKVEIKEMRLSDCDPGVDRSAVVYRFPEAADCSCTICDPREQSCETPPSKRSQPSGIRSTHNRNRLLDDKNRLGDIEDLQSMLVTLLRNSKDSKMLP